MAKLALTQIEQLQNLGAYLRQVRQDKGLPLEVLANQIFIRPALLHALESGNDGELPEPVFIQGFIRRYAEALGLDGQAIAQEFRVTPVDVLPTPDLLAQADTNGVVEPQTRHSIKVLEQAPPASTLRSSSKAPLPLLLSLAALAAILGLGIWGLVSRSSSPSRANGTDPVAETTPEDPADGETPALLEPTDPVEAEANALLEAPVVVSASLRDRAWLSVIADGTNVYEGVAESGFAETWTAQTSVVFRTGNAGGVELSVNGDRAVVLGSSGVVRTVTLTPESDVDSVQSP
ncbi:MAG: helix-turn-helix domain-containing protein [Nodosilinea sp.]